MQQLTGAILLAGSPIHDADIRYLTGFSAPDPVVLVKKEHSLYLVVPLLEIERARRIVKGATVWSPEDLKLNPDSKRKLSGWIMGVMRKLQINSVVVSPLFPVGLAQKLVKSHVRLTVTEGDLIPERQIKRPDEIGNIREVQQAAVGAMRTAWRRIKRAKIGARNYLYEGHRRLTSELIRQEINRYLLDHDCLGQGTIVSVGVQSADPHETGWGPIRSGEPIVIDIFPQHLRHGYWGDLTRTVVRGKASGPILKMYRAVRSAQRSALRLIRHGAWVSAIHRAAVNAVEAKGYRTGLIEGRAQGFIHSTGHGVGLDIHEAPGINMRPVRLKAGNVVTVEPGLYFHHQGGIRIEDVVVVTKTGWALLSPCEYVFEL